MTHRDWVLHHKAKVASITLKQKFKSLGSEVAYFKYANMVEAEPDFCELYKTNKICHVMKDLNCRFCACPHFVVNEDETRFSCKARGIISSPQASFLPCISCNIPHTETFVKKQLKGTYEN